MRTLLFCVAIIGAAVMPALAEEPPLSLQHSQTITGNLLDRFRAMRLAQSDSDSDMVCCHARGSECRAPTPIAPDSVQWVSRSDCDQFVYGGIPPKTCDPSLCGH